MNHVAGAGQRTGTLQESRVRQDSLGLYAQNDTRWLPWLRSVAGLRADRLAVDVASSIAANGGRRAEWIASPRNPLTARVIVDEVAGKGHQVVASEVDVSGRVPGIDAEEFAGLARKKGRADLMRFKERLEAGELAD